MAHRANKRPPGRIKSSIVARLNTRLFFRLLGIYFTMDLLLLFLFCGGLFVWSEQQAAQISTLVEERGVPSAEATEWMTAGDYTVTAGTPEADGLRLPGWLPSPEETRGGVRYFNPGTVDLLLLVTFSSGDATSYTLQMPGDEPYAIRQEADSMKELVEQLLFLARGDNDSMHIEIETFDLTEVAAEVLKETGMIDQTHTFSARWEGAVPVCADVGLTKQALRILVDNSIKYTPAGGHITLSAALRDGMARLSVQDEGQGIDAGSLPHVFDRFYRTDQSRARQTGGTGLGLAIAKWIVDRHGGWFEVRSWPGVGTRMTIVLPVADLDAGGADEDAEQTRPA